MHRRSLEPPPTRRGTARSDRQQHHSRAGDADLQATCLYARRLDGRHQGDRTAVRRRSAEMAACVSRRGPPNLRRGPRARSADPPATTDRGEVASGARRVDDRIVGNLRRAGNVKHRLGRLVSEGGNQPRSLGFVPVRLSADTAEPPALCSDHLADVGDAVVHPPVVHYRVPWGTDPTRSVCSRRTSECGVTVQREQER